MGGQVTAASLGSCGIGDQLADGLRDRIGRFPGQEVSGDRNHAPLIRAGEKPRVTLGAFNRRDAVTGAVEYDRRYADLGHRREPLLDCFQGRIARRPAESVPIGMDYDIDEIGIVE